MAVIFLELVKHNETIYQQQHDDHLTSYLTGIETTMYDILCSVHTAIFQLNSHVERYESRDIVSKDLIGLQSVFARDYVILQDINIILEYFLNAYKVISATMTMQK
jgi:hypothetical protein